MAENENGAQKSEQPTEKRLREAKEKGEVARSRELATATLMLVGCGALLGFGEALGQALLQILQRCLVLPREQLLDSHQMAQLLIDCGQIALIALLPIFCCLFVAALLAPLLTGGWLFSGASMQPKFSRLNPLSGLKRMLSARSLAELGKALAKFGLVLAASLIVLAADRAELLALAKQPQPLAINHGLKLLGQNLLWLCTPLLLIAAVDAPMQWLAQQKKMRMTRQEVKDEHKDSDGKPEVKSRIRALQRERAERRMMGAVPQADVVISNPTHFAVALKYDENAGTAPLLLAKGRDLLALKIREIAAAHDVCQLQSPALARAIYYSTELDEPIPAGLYQAVAQVLAWVYQVRRPGFDLAPPAPQNLPIPDELRRDD
ncbi:flagellar biosynthetic protein FlhB [Ventosimonas gracilis]|uniref:Flagellar biosynthetic protein FlhB n=1 Tax=Ventosimonas gracilis TaxID=1680762 RepID=A0A139SU61_9GAMM|nr:flagellar biosynthesis protein FlhB [Ventosimonas gracilis]KXU38127.1 flagellar biosynthetic protein FlhB [Ventosimonas gracilis]